VYEGPLDLLLALVRREGVELRKLPVARICDAYLAFLGQVEDIDVDEAGEYLVMAATLCQLKARELLPKVALAPEEEEIDPREALERRLIEYERVRCAAEELGRREMLGRDTFASGLGASVAGDATGTAELGDAPAFLPVTSSIDPGTDAWGLATLFFEIAARSAAPPPVHEVERETATLAERARWVVGKLDDGQEHQLAELFLELPARAARLHAFLAVLELARHQVLDLWQRLHLGAVTLLGKVRADAFDTNLVPEPEAGKEEWNG
jgi:segregation and condensation protein A